MQHSQNKAPLYEAMKNFRQNRVVPFDVPGHKGGRGNEELTEFLGINCLKADDDLFERMPAPFGLIR